jgi:hypothetical protein
MIQHTLRQGRVIAAHCSGPIEQRPVAERDRTRSKLHVSNVRRQQREAKRALESLFA